MSEKLEFTWIQQLKPSLEQVLQPLVSYNYILQYNVFNFSNFNIVSKGTSSNLMKASATRRRSKQTIEEAKTQKELERQQTIERLARMD